MEVVVHYFAALREERGCDQERINIVEGASISDLFDVIFGESSLADLPVLYALNQEYVSSDATLFEQAEVCFIPPLGGG